MNGLELCAGVGMLSLGIGLAVPEYRTVCAVEIEAYPSAVLVARQQDGSLPPFAIWDDLASFDGRPWRGSVQIVSGGYPCQPFSIAGQRRGSADERHLWPHVARIVAEVQPRLCFFENVANHLNLGFEQVHDDLQGMGYDVAAGLFTAAEVGASHKRQRLFILAHASGVGHERGGHTRRGWDGLTNGGSDVGVFAPGPDDAGGWGALLAHDGSLAPALEPSFRRAPDGNDSGLDEPMRAYRTDRIRAVGNGVVSVTAALAFRTLLRQLEEQP